MYRRVRQYKYTIAKTTPKIHVAVYDRGVFVKKEKGKGKKM